MESVEVSDNEGHTWTYVKLRGIWLRDDTLEMLKPKGDAEAHFDNTQKLSIRDDDIYVATFVKSGTHWIWEIVGMLMRNEATYDENVKEVAMLEFISPDGAAQLPSPRILNCHYPLHLMPEGIREKRCKIIHVRRNVKDVIISYMHHLNAFDRAEGLPEMSLETLLPLFLGEPFYDWYNWADYVKEWEQLGKDNPDTVLNLTFEDMKKDSVSEIKKIVTFLGLDRSEELIQNVADKCSFKKLQQANKDVKKGSTEDKVIKNHDFMYRKGEVGDWKNWFTVAQNERIDRWLEENLKGTELKVAYTL